MDQNNYTHQTSAHTGKSFSKRLIIRAILRNWYWFGLAAILGFATAFVFTKSRPGSFRSTMTILLINQPHASTFSQNSLDNNLAVQDVPVNVNDEQAVVSAYSLQLQTLENLNWKTKWYKKTLFGKKDIYKNDPFDVSFVEDSVIKGAELKITPLSDQYYRVECDYKDKPADTQRIVRFSSKAAFGKPFINDWFHFTLYPSRPPVPADGSQYVLIFNDLGFMALDYQGALEVKVPAQESDILTVELKGENVMRNVDYMNALGNTYLKFGLDQKNTSAINTLNFIRTELSGIADSLRISGDRYTDFRTKHKVVDLTTEGGIVLQKMEDVSKQESLLRLKLDYYDQLNKHLNDQDDLKSFVAPPMGDPDPDLSGLVEKLATLYSQRSTLALTLEPKNPKMVAVNSDIALTQQLIKNNVASHINATQAQLSSLEGQKKETDATLTSFPATERDYLDIKRGFDVNSTLYNFLLQKRAEAEIALASNSPDAKILDPATFPTTSPIGLKPIVNVLIGIIIGMLVAFGIILLREFLNNRLRESEEVLAALDLAVAGEIPHNKFKTELPVSQHPKSEITECFRNLRANLRHVLKQDNRAIIAVHSAKAGEGKSFISANLAALLASGGKKALLIQGDKHNTQLEELFGATPRKDLADYLGNATLFSQVISNTNIPCLSYVRAGTPDSPLSELMDNTQRMQEFLKEAKTAFDFVVIDTPPITILSDARTMASHADINLFVLRLGTSTIQELSYINTTAEEETVKNMIVVLNDTPGTKKKGKRSAYFND